MAYRGPKVVRRAKEFGWRRPMLAAMMVGGFVVTLLCCYVYAYARVTAAGFDVANLRRDLRKAQKREEALRAERSRLCLFDTVALRAQQMGMVPATPSAARVFAAESAPAAASVAVLPVADGGM